MPFGQAVSADPLKAQPYRTQRSELPEDLWQPLYDRMDYPAAGTNSLAFFSVPQGQSTTLIRAGATGTFAKTYRDTNMQNANVIPTKLFKFVGISLGFCHEDEGEDANASDRDKIRSGGYLQFRIVDKDILFLPLVALPEVNPFVTASSITATILGAAGGGGANVPMYKLPINITLNPYENFNFNLFWDSGAAPVTVTKAVDIYVILQGFMRRPT